METLIREALKEQFGAGLAMLRACIVACPDDLWTAEFPCPPDDDRTLTRTFERIAFHAVYFTHLYLGQDEASFETPVGLAVYKREANAGLWSPPWSAEPFELPNTVPAHAKSEILEYVDYVMSLLRTLDTVDLAAPSSGFHWYPRHSKLAHELLNLRHLQGHVGQLTELLMARGIDVDWVS